MASRFAAPEETSVTAVEAARAALRRGWFTAATAVVGVGIGLLAWLDPPTPVLVGVGAAAILAVTAMMWVYYGREECTCSVTRL